MTGKIGAIILLFSLLLITGCSKGSFTEDCQGNGLWLENEYTCSQGNESARYITGWACDGEAFKIYHDDKIEIEFPLWLEIRMKIHCGEIHVDRGESLANASVQNE